MLRIPTYSRRQILLWLGPNTMAKAVNNVQHVSEMEWKNGTLTGCVQGTEKHPYKTSVKFSTSEGLLEINSKCSCPMRTACKHVVAILIAGIDMQSTEGGAGISRELNEWLQTFRIRHKNNNASAPIKSKPPTHILLYALAKSPFEDHYLITCYKAPLSRDGEILPGVQAWSGIEKALIELPKFLRDEDLEILPLLWSNRDRFEHDKYHLTKANSTLILEKALATNRFYSEENLHPLESGSPLRKGANRPGNIQWGVANQERLKPVLGTDPPSDGVIFCRPFWYIDKATNELGIIDLQGDETRTREYLDMPPISIDESSALAEAILEIAPDLPAPPSLEAENIQAIIQEPVPVLHFDTVEAYSPVFGSIGKTITWDFCTVSFDYGVANIREDVNVTLVKSRTGAFFQITRDTEAEKKRTQQLRATGMVTAPTNAAYGKNVPRITWAPRHLEEWPEFMQNKLSALQDKGWRIEISKAFSFNEAEIEDIDGQIIEAADGWFDLEMGIKVGDQSIRLEPLLAKLFRNDSRWLSGSIDDIREEEVIRLTTDAGERLRVRAKRLKPIVKVLIDLFNGFGKGETLRMSRLDAGRLEALCDTGRWQFHGDTTIRDLAKRLRESSGVTEVPLPKTLSGELRAYQHQGMNWMQFLREHNLSGVLADDMGLGKTMQTLAHLLVEKENDRLNQPALIVVPTSLIHNWCNEAAKFAPTLRVLNLHGTERKDKFEQIPKHDLVLTTYPLIWRDQEELAKHSYHYLILDEAQVVKNAFTKAATAIRALDAKHRLCLTGTPLENHLGELWSLFDFLLPGFLGNPKDFAKLWKTPIEKQADMARRELLACRIRPFILRRRKDEVAKELPQKTIIIQTVDLEGGQRDLYETVRTAMQDKVRDAIAAQGFNRSHIVMLDALLKLRQVCCDPRLVKLSKAHKVKESAKMEWLMSMLPELIQEGRRILLFSQFTSMLDLIGKALIEEKIPYVTLTGDTRDRATPVNQFQSGKVPLFLISLKTGGVGLNLTAADTVIHYDPWWNPAVENQATDRAHRIGQDKPVFVYKLIAAGSIEEKILELQEKKALLAEGILSNDSTTSVKFSDNDLDALFEPIN